MRILLAIHNAYADHTSGAAQSMRIILEWLGQAGHDVRALATARFDAAVRRNLADELTEQGIGFRRTPPSKAMLRYVKGSANLGPGQPTLDFALNGVPVTTLASRARLNTPADRFESDQLLFLLDEQIAGFGPDVVLTYGGHPVIGGILRRARKRGVTTVFGLRNYGYDDRRFYTDVDHVLTASPYLSRYYRERIGLRSVGIESPIDWSAVEAPDEMRRFVTFVNPFPAKGSLLFARLADMLGSRRPDIPLLVVQSAHTAGPLNAIAGIDFRKYPHIMAAPATPRPADFFALTRILLVPSVFHEPFGRVAAEALINSIPPIVSDRGALPDTVGAGGIVIPLPAWMTPESRELPSEGEVAPWFDTICALWDDSDRYKGASEKARSAANERYAEDVMRRRYCQYFETLPQAEPLFD